MKPLLEVVDLHKRFAVGRPGLRAHMRAVRYGGPPPQPAYLHAVDGVSFRIEPGESVALVGESGCGKSTLVRMLARLLDPTEGGAIFAEQDIAAIPARLFARHPLRSQIQLVFQDPTDSLNPRHTAFDTIAEPLRLLGGIREGKALCGRVMDLAGQVGLPAELLPRYPHQLSGGQKARVGIARAIALRPKLLILDEPTAALDVSVQAVILRLLAELKRELRMSYLFVSHDLNVVRMLCDRVLVMYLGKLIETGPAQTLFDNPLHPYTKALIGAIPQLGGRGERRILAGEPRSPVDPNPASCRFLGRCPKGREHCGLQPPRLLESSTGRLVACHFPEPLVAAPAYRTEASAHG